MRAFNTTTCFVGLCTLSFLPFQLGAVPAQDTGIVADFAALEAESNIAASTNVISDDGEHTTNSSAADTADELYDGCE